jgi:hypothetical protein
LPTIPNFPQTFADEHHAWHLFPQGAHGRPSRSIQPGAPGSGLEFLTFHRNYITRVLAWYSARPGADTAAVARWLALPAALRQTSVWTPQTANQEQLLQNPRANFATDDQLGRFIENGIHNFLHNASAEAFNEPILADLHSVTSTFFYQIHGLVDEWWRRWQTASTPTPTEPAEPVALTVGGAPFQAAIGQPGDTDVYQFQVATAGAYRMETQGATDVVMSLFAGANPTPLATDDDSGEGTNARIDISLAAGTYSLRVMHFSSAATGAYRVSVATVGAPPPGEGTELQVNGPAVQAQIAPAGERDLYRFQAPSVGTYRIETQGPSDVVITLLGPDSQTTPIATDDDSGVGTNALLMRSLQPGTYFVRVRHFSPTQTGSYSISVSR